MSPEAPGATVRAATAADVPAIAAMAGELYAMHHAWDARRFWNLGGRDPEVRAGRESFFGTQIDEPGVILLVAEQRGTVVGYAYMSIEEHDYENLLESSAWLHDIFVKPEARGTGAADALFEAARERGTANERQLLVLTVAELNAHAQRFFARHGMRVTMREMTLEQPRAADSDD